MTRGTRGSAFKNKISDLERAKDQNPFASGGRGFSLPSDYKQTEAAAFKQSGADMSNYGNSKGFLDKFVGGMDSYLETQKKSDTDKYLDFLKGNIRSKYKSINCSFVMIVDSIIPAASSNHLLLELGSTTTRNGST